MNLPRNERVAWVAWDSRKLALTLRAELLSLNRSSLYYQPVPPSSEELWIKRRIDEIYTQYPFYGSRKITAELQKEMTINREAVQRHMREMGLSAICPGPTFDVLGTCGSPINHTLKVTSVDGQSVALPYFVPGRRPTPTLTPTSSP